LWTYVWKAITLIHQIWTVRCASTSRHGLTFPWVRPHERKKQFKLIIFLIKTYNREGKKSAKDKVNKIILIIYNTYINL